VEKQKKSERSTALSVEKISSDKVTGGASELNEVVATPKKMLIEKRLRSAAKSGRVKCADALSIAKSLGPEVSSREVGKVADEIGIRITACQLGCF